MSRFSAFAIHLGISLAIFFVLAYLVVFEWYPGLFFDTDGGWQGIRIIIGVDLVLGPTLTLIVFKAGKPGLKTDLALIGLLQFVCLFAGTYVVYEQRPQLVAFNDGRFTVMTDDDFSDDTALPDLTSFPGDDPKWVLVEIPQDPIAEAEFRSATFKQGKLIATATENYIPSVPIINSSSATRWILRSYSPKKAARRPSMSGWQNMVAPQKTTASTYSQPVTLTAMWAFEKAAVSLSVCSGSWHIDLSVARRALRPQPPHHPRGRPRSAIG